MQIQEDIHVADIDGDGDLDIVSADQMILLLGMKMMEQLIHHLRLLICYNCAWAH